MGADEEVGERGCSGSAAASVFEMGFSCQEGCGKWKRLPFELGRWKYLFELLRGLEPCRDFGVDYRVYPDIGLRGGRCELTGRPFEPFGILAEYIQEYIAIDQDHLHPNLASVPLFDRS